MSGERVRRSLMGRAGSVVIAGCVALVMSLTSCAEIESTTDEGYQPASLSEPDEAGVRVVELTELAGDRIDLESARVQAEDGQKAVPYAALIYDGKGGAWVYEVVGKHTYRRAKITVARTQGGKVFLTAGPAVGTEVVTQGSTQVYGAEVEMSGKH